MIEGPQQILLAVAALQKGYDPVLIENEGELFQYFEAENSRFPENHYCN
ncbi:hypothetical protein SynA1562_01024 [Synechococcus sp. A15-62]|nr:hypothetical protein SynA1562_01024 [Synechococcus sp. A15-62]